MLKKAIVFSLVSFVISPIFMGCDKIFAAEPGSLKWQFETSGGFYSPAIGDDGTIYVGNRNNCLYAINPDGSEKWKYKIDGSFYHPAIGNDGTIYVGSNNKSFYAINPDGTRKWSFMAKDNMIGSPAIGEDGTIYAGSLDGNLYAIQPNGKMKWRYNTGAGVGSPFIGADGIIYVDSAHKLYAINPDGSKKWIYQAKILGSHNPAIGEDGTIYLPGGFLDKNLYLINSEDGSLKDSIEISIRRLSSPVIGVDGTIYIGHEGEKKSGKIKAINPNNGQIAWNFNTNNYIYTSAAIGNNGIIYVPAGYDGIYALRPDGSKKWSYKTKGSTRNSAPAIGPDGTIYVGCSNGMLYAINGSSKGLAETSWPKYQRNNKNAGRK